MNQSSRRRISGWPWTALAVWLGAWAVHLYLKRHGSGFVWFLGLPLGLGAFAALWAARHGHSRSRQVLLLVGFPVSWLLLSLKGLPSWAWLMALLVLLVLYPIRSWRDAPIFPTPLNALKGLPAHAPLFEGARLLDAGCGAGDGLRALCQIYPNVHLTGIEISLPLTWVTRWRCPWAQVVHADMWSMDWSPYDMVYLFQRPESMFLARQKAMQELLHGAWLVSLEFPIPGLKAFARTCEQGGRQVWLYQAPFVLLQSTNQQEADFCGFESG